jgi:hypothetical protein
MRAQLRHLIEAAEFDTVTLQILPTAVGDHPGYDGPFTVLSFDGFGEPDMGYAENPMGSMHIEQEEHVTRARLVFDRLQSVALPPTESIALVEEAVAQM